ncbi:hypothetical protein E4U56_008284 [Claviceps arundinis]|uniref:Uncharacterized protein n=1 Tax=Claviceps arundinis TaxID=1623583 RepID=A0A9P7MST5_9HYPO|nr:hypothetical protein E4U56_008284 [Claviceps arundinis]
MPPWPKSELPYNFPRRYVSAHPRRESLSAELRPVNFNTMVYADSSSDFIHVFAR